MQKMNRRTFMIGAAALTSTAALSSVSPAIGGQGSNSAVELSELLDICTTEFASTEAILAEGEAILTNLSEQVLAEAPFATATATHCRGFPPA